MSTTHSRTSVRQVVVEDSRRSSFLVPGVGRRAPRRRGGRRTAPWRSAAGPAGGEQPAPGSPGRSNGNRRQAWTSSTRAAKRRVVRLRGASVERRRRTPRTRAARASRSQARREQLVGRRRGSPVSARNTTAPGTRSRSREHGVGRGLAVEVRARRRRRGRGSRTRRSRAACAAGGAWPAGPRAPSTARPATARPSRRRRRRTRRSARCPP